MATNNINSSILSIFRALPQKVRDRITLAHISAVIRLKSQFLNALTYTEKCQVSQNEIAGMLYGQLFWERGYSLPVILEILRAEENYFFSSSEFSIEDDYILEAA